LVVRLLAAGRVANHPEIEVSKLVRRRGGEANGRDTVFSPVSGLTLGNANLSHFGRETNRWFEEIKLREKKKAEQTVNKVDGRYRIIHSHFAAGSS